MGMFKEPVPVQIVDAGTAPEFFVTHVPKVEAVTDSDCVRLYACAVRSRGDMVLQYTVVIPRHRMEVMLKDIGAACAAHPVLLAFVPETPGS